MTPSLSTDSRSPSRRPALVALGLLSALVALTALRSLPPAPRGQDAPAGAFSAARARAVLERLIGSDGARPAGSPAAAAFRERLVVELRALGLEPAVERTWTCGEEGACAEVANVTARIEAGRGGPAVLLTAHTDSVAAGPGAADDATGVAVILESVRALLAAPGREALARPVALLFTDGEEAGLLGAEAWVRARGTAGLAREVAAVVNLEARGASGLDHLFETGAENAGLIATAGRALPRPSASSLFYEIYRRLPNDTDFSVFKRAGAAGLNFAFIGDPLRYHTPRDEPRLLDSGSLQHQGEHALATVRALASAPALSPGPGRAVYFDLFGLTLVSWPEAWSLPLAVAGLLLVLAAAWRRGALRGRGWAAGLVAWLAIVAVAALAGWGLRALLARLGAFPDVWVAGLPMATLGFVALGAASACVARLFRKAAPGTLWAGAWMAWGALAVALAVGAPGASHLAIAPLVVAGVSALPGRAGAPGLLAALVPLAAAGVLWLPLAWTLPVAMGAGALPAVAAIAALVASPAVEAFAAAPPGRMLAGLGLVVAALSLAGLALPRFTPERPQPASLRYLESGEPGGRESLWVLDPPSAPLPASLARLAPFARRATLPWSRATSFAAPAPDLGLAPPELERLGEARDGERRRLRLRLRSPRGASRAVLWLPLEARLLQATVAGVSLPAPPGHRLVIATLPPEGVELELVIGGEPCEATLLDLSSGLPEAGAALAAARGESAVPIGLGDATLVARRVRL